MSKKTYLRRLQDDVDAAERKLRAEIAREFFPGRPVHVTWGDNECPATVVHVYGERVEVRSVHGKTYQVGAYRLVEFGWRTP